jgi:hypothetical protein
MIAEEQHTNIDTIKPALTGNKGKSVSCIISCLKFAIIPFLQAYNLSKSNSLNEDDLTQIFYSQVQFIIRDRNYPFNVGNQERDLTKQSKGIPDLFFYANKFGEPPISIFSIECKRLPAPLPKSREKEYVQGNNQNGGIERYKIEKHGKQLVECGMIAFIEEKDFDFWLICVNKWIKKLSDIDNLWRETEVLNIVEQQKDEFAYLASIAHRAYQKDIKLHHFWIDIK